MVTFPAGEATDTGIDRVLICNKGAASGEAVLMYSTLGTSVNKAAGDSLKVFVNHTFNGT